MSSWVVADDAFLYALQALVVSPSSQPCQCRLPQSSDGGRKCEKRIECESHRVQGIPSRVLARFQYAASLINYLPYISILLLKLA